MPKRSSKHPKHPDVNVLAASIVRQVVEPVQSVALPEESDGKNPAAVALGRLGGMKGGKARAAVLSAKQRSQIAANAAIARWAKRKKVE